MTSPIICFGQQPNGFFPKRYLIAKINTARALQKSIGGKIVFFYHDSDADYRETITLLKDLQTGAEVRLNFTQENKLQKKHSPLYLKRIPNTWQAEILKQLPRFTNQAISDLLASVKDKLVADFCLAMYQHMGILEGITIMRSSNSDFRRQAQMLSDTYFADIPYQNEIVRVKVEPSPNSEPRSTSPNTLQLTLHEGGGLYTTIPITDKIQQSQITPGAQERFGWMQSVIHCTHYIFGKGEKDYLKFEDFPEVQFIQRNEIDNPEYAWIEKI